MPRLKPKFEDLHPARAELETLLDAKSAALKTDSEIRAAFTRFESLAQSAGASSRSSPN